MWVDEAWPHRIFKGLCWHRSHRLRLPCYRRQHNGPLCRKHRWSCWGF